MIFASDACEENSYWMQALDQGIGYNQLGDHWHNISGLEVVLANGDIVRTGQWAADGAPTAHLCKNSFGPQIDGLFLQSNLGIVTKMSLWLQPRPQTYMSVKVEVDKFSDIAPLVDALGLLHREDILQSNPLIGDVLGYLSMQHSAEQLYEGAGAIPDDIIRQLQQKHGLGAWTAIFDFYGTKAMVQARLERCQSVMLAACPGACITHRFTEVPEGEFLDARKIAEVGRGEPAGMVGISRSRMINFALPSDVQATELILTTSPSCRMTASSSSNGSLRQEKSWLPMGSTPSWAAEFSRNTPSPSR
jgi:hypothetical protein